jgi:ubiquinone/menaquinone biosynthesis C-methylase UbiE
MKNTQKKADQYNDPSFDYLHYWDNRDYEHEAEKMAINKLLEGKHFKTAIDIGGGYGRLSVLLEKFADEVTLVEPSEQQLELAKDFLRDHQTIKRKLMQADRLEFVDQSVDLVMLIRVMHHLPDPTAEFREIRRVLSDDGYGIIEVANFMHIRNRLKYLVLGKKMPVEPVDIRSKKNRREDVISFVNHNPKTVTKQLAHAGLKVDRILSVSNLRTTALKKTIPRSVMLSVEGILQPTLAKAYFGPSIFFLVRRAS